MVKLSNCFHSLTI